MPQPQPLHQLLRQRPQVAVLAGHQAEVRALAAEPLVVLDLPEPLVVLEPVLRVLEQLRQEQLLERSRLLVRRLQVLVLLAWWVLRSLRLRLLIR